ncbi:MAG: hypothetical protein HYT71_03060 [Candidatus Aenigmarchaeota archaeon]|nr:hypothetical protein [Candidatus Aenigmarchaeota archaeon]
MANVIYRFMPAILFILLFSSDVSANSIVSDYCVRNHCVDTAVDAIASVFKGMEIYVSPAEVNAYNCKKSDFLNLTIISPLLSTDTKILVNGEIVCEIKGSVLPKTEMCTFSLEGGDGGSQGYDNIIINIIAKPGAGILSETKELSKNFGIKINHITSDDEKNVIASMKSSQISLAAAYSKIEDLENAGYNMSSARKTLIDSETSMENGKENLRICRFNYAISDYKNAKHIADAALRDAENDKDSQNNEKFSLITGKFLTSAMNPIFGIMLLLVIFLGYQLNKEKKNKSVKLDL